MDYHCLFVYISFYQSVINYEWIHRNIKESFFKRLKSGLLNFLTSVLFQRHQLTLLHWICWFNTKLLQKSTNKVKEKNALKAQRFGAIKDRDNNWHLAKDWMVFDWIVMWSVKCCSDFNLEVFLNVLQTKTIIANIFVTGWKVSP